MIEVEVFGAGATLPAAEVRRLCVLAAGAAGVQHGHLAVEFVDAARIAELNARHRDRPVPTDVLSFPVDGAQALAGVEPAAGRTVDGGAQVSPRELGDVLICPEHTRDLREAVVHGVLHLAGLDHETDRGEMLALQRRVLADARP
jgi:probable rRNA maturation factor